mgnify:CR=1 FL=1
MRVLFDTNVIFSAFATRGLAQAVFELCLGRHTIIISEHILSELAIHLGKKLMMPNEKVQLITDYLKESCILGEEASLEESACRDKKDIHILGLAKKMGADFIITGDTDLLVLKRYRRTSIVTPRGFWEKEKKR